MKTYILAEMASSHEGSPKLARSIIESAAAAKADGILLQIIDLDSYIIPSDPDYPVVKKIYFSQKMWVSLIEKANAADLDVIANVYDVNSAKFCRGQKVKGFKLHSSNLENKELVKEVAISKKELLVSVGALNEKEIREAVIMIRSFNKKANITLMYGLQNFPTNPEGININFISQVAASLKMPFGYQDHSEPMSPASTYLPLLCVAKGVRVIEKHITYDRSKKGLDYQSALNPYEFAQFVKDIKVVDKILGKKTNEVSKDELQYKKYKSLMKVVVVKNIDKGEFFSKENLAIMRAKEGQVPGIMMEKIMGKEAKSAYKKYEYLKRTEL